MPRSFAPPPPNRLSLTSFSFSSATRMHTHSLACSSCVPRKATAGSRRPPQRQRVGWQQRRATLGSLAGSRTQTSRSQTTRNPSPNQKQCQKRKRAAKHSKGCHGVFDVNALLGCSSTSLMGIIHRESTTKQLHYKPACPYVYVGTARRGISPMPTFSSFEWKE